MFEGKTYWLVGASEGLGAALARKLGQAGASVILSARSKDKLEDLAAEMPRARALPLDVTDRASVEAAAKEAGEIDGMIYIAGAYEPLTAQRWDADAVTLMCEVNFMGGAHVLGQVVPQFVRRDAGHIVLIGSLAGHRGLPRAIGYGASKAGLMHFGETLYADLRKTGVRVQNVNPGFIKTRLTDKNEFDMPQLMTPEAAAEHVMKAMRSGRFETSFPKPFAWLFTLGKHLPRRLFLSAFGGLEKDDAGS